MSHPFGDLVSQHLHRKHGLSQSKLAAGILQAPTVITAMCKGRRLIGPQARERVIAIIRWLHQQDALEALDEANALLSAAGMSSLDGSSALEAALVQSLRPSPELRQGAATSRPEHNHNLPAPATSLIGRDEDVAAACKLLRNQAIRLLTLLGPPGVGKTRLALQVAWQSRDDFADGAWFVSLAPVSDSQFVAASIVQAFDLPNPGAPPLVVLKNHLRDKQLLLVLDNFEQLLDAATIVAELLATAPNIKIFTTSRAALQLSSEHLFEVQPLAEPSAVELFVQRARAIKPGFALSDGNAQTVAEICRRLDGLPLAIELAAARTKLFDPPQLLARLSSRLDLLTSHAQDLPERQRTLQGTIEWSYNLLSPEERTLFRRLGVFARGCSLEAAEHVTGDGLQTPLFDLLQSLADKSLVTIEVQDGEPRFSMLETIREYALIRLSASDESEVARSRHAEYFVEYAESIEAKLSGPDQLTWLRRLERDIDNMRTAMAYARRNDNISMLIRFVSALGPWLRRIHEPEGWAWLPALLDRPNRHLTKLMRAKGLIALARLITDCIGDWPRARLMLEESVQLSEELGAAQLLARSLFDLGQLSWSQGEYAKATDYCEQGATLFMQSGDNLAVADSLNWQAAIARDRGDCDRAAQLFEQSLQRFHEINDSFNEGMVVNGMGDLAFIRGDYDEAQQRYEQARLLWREVEVLTALSHRGLGHIAYVKGDLALADSLLEAGVTIARKWMNATVLQWNLHHYGFTKYLAGDVASAMARLREGIMMQHRQLHRLCIAESLERFAWIAADQHQSQRAARLFGAADALRKWMGASLPLGDKPLYDRYLEMARSALDSDDFGKAWAEGAAMTLDQAVEYALSEDS